MTARARKLALNAGNHTTGKQGDDSRLVQRQRVHNHGILFQCKPGTAN